MNRIEELNEACKASISEEEQKNLEKIKDFYYYSAEYVDEIIKRMKERKIDSKEFVKNPLNIRSLVSSARLCFNYLYDEADDFENEIENDLKISIAPTKMDAIKDDIYYECKCREVIYGEKERLRISYRNNSELFKELVDPNIVETKRHHAKDAKNEYDYCVFRASDLGILNIGDKYYWEYHFNIKQLICHLIAIAHSGDKNVVKTLQYIIFKPNEEEIIKYPHLKKVYDELDEEIIAIENSQAIKKFNKNHNIELDVKYEYISNVRDYIIYNKQ